jgi:hypothetical protein
MRRIRQNFVAVEKNSRNSARGLLVGCQFERSLIALPANLARIFAGFGL